MFAALNVYMASLCTCYVRIDLFQLASKVNAAILASSNQDSRLSLLEFYKLLLWAQHELDQKKVFFSRMTDLGTATFDSTGLTISDSEKL